jgi:WD40 repeat protein
MRQNSPAIFFKTIHYDQITDLERLSSTVFATASSDGHLNIWDLRMESL